MEITTKDNDKQSLGYSVLKRSDDGRKRKRDVDSGDDSDPIVNLAMYRMENKIPVKNPSKIAQYIQLCQLSFSKSKVMPAFLIRERMKESVFISVINRTTFLVFNKQAT